MTDRVPERLSGAVLSPASSSPAGGGPRRSGLRVGLACALVLAVSLTPVGGVRRSEAGFVAILAQTKVYLNILIDEWEKYSRILEDHLDKVTGVMQPFNEIHAGVRELTNTNGLRDLYRLGDSYRASVSDPRCFVPGASGPCALHRDFIPPEVRSIDYELRTGVRQGASGWDYTLEQLEGEVFERSALDTAQEAVMAALQIYDPAAAAEARITQQRIERNVERNRWQIRRIRSIANRSTYAARNFVFRADQLPGPNPLPGGANDGCPDVPADFFGDPAAGVAPDPDATLLDQAINADCEPASGSVDDPLAEQAHMSEIEAKTLRAGSLIGVVEMASLELERQSDRESAALESAERAEQQRRREMERQRERFDCFRTTGSLAYVDGGACGAVVSGPETLRRQEAQLTSLVLF